MNNPMDLTKFDGHSQGPWEWIPGRGCHLGMFWSAKDGPVCTFGYRSGYDAIEGDEPEGQDKALVEAAPLLLAEVKSLRMEVDLLNEYSTALRISIQAGDNKFHYKDRLDKASEMLVEFRAKEL